MSFSRVASFCQSTAELINYFLFHFRVEAYYNLIYSHNIWYSFIAYISYTLFSNSLVRARPALSRKILSSWMARAKIARAWPALFWCCFYQHQSSARPAPGADQRVSERSSTKLRPKFRLHGQMPHNSRAALRRRGFFLKLKLFCHILIIFLFVFFSLH